MNRYVVMWIAIVLATPVQAEPVDSLLTLQQVLVLTLENSPELAVFPAEFRAGEARILQAGLRANPDATITVEDFAGTGAFGGAGELQTTLEFSQLIELGGKRSARRHVAESARDVTQSEYEVKRVEVLADATVRFVELVAAQLRNAVAHEATVAAEAALRSARERLEAGKGSMLEEGRAAVTLARNHVAEERASRERDAGRQRLAAAWGSSTAEFGRADADLFALKPTPSFEALVSRIAGSPEIARWNSETRLREAELRAARSMGAPGLTIGGGARKYEGPDAFAFVAEVSLPLPLFNRNQGGRLESQALLEKTAMGRQATELRLHALLFGLHQRLAMTAGEAEAARQEILPQAENALKIAEEGYRQGRYSYLELADAQRTLLEVKQQYIDAAEVYHTLVAEIERLTGQPLQP